MFIAAVVLPAWLDPMLSLLLKTLAGLVSLYVLPKLPAATAQFFAWLSGKADSVKSDYAKGVLQRLSNLVGEKVLAAENTAIEDLKTAILSGNMSVADLKVALAKVKTDVVAQVKADATAQGLWDAVKFVFNDEGALMNWIMSLVETHVATLAPSGLQTTTASGALSAVALAGTKPAVP